MIIKTQKVDPRAEGGARILIKESDRDVSSLEKSSTDNDIVGVQKFILIAPPSTFGLDTCPKFLTIKIRSLIKIDVD